MNLEDFFVGQEFHTTTGMWRCTDIGTRVIVAIRIDQVMVCKHDCENENALATDDQSWFDGPPYAVAEYVIDEFDFGGCSLDQETFAKMQTVTAHIPKPHNL